MYDLEKKYYTYVLMDPRFPGPYRYGAYEFECKPFYIGKGTGYRMTAHFTEAKRLMGELDAREPSIADPLVPPSQSMHIRKEEMKLFTIIDIMKGTGAKPLAKRLKEQMNEFQAFEHEAYMINLIGRQQKRKGPLTNENDGEQFLGPKPIKLKAFVGMNNIKEEGEPSVFQSGGRRVCEPRIVLNADVTAGGRVLKRSGNQKFVELPNAHSLWSDGTVMLAVSANKLYRIDSGVPVHLLDLTGTEDRLFYASVDNQIYFSNLSNKGIYDPGTAQVLPWGYDHPPTPLLDSSKSFHTAYLDAGIYRLAYTELTPAGVHGPASPVAEVEITTSGLGFSISNGDGYHLWMSEPDGAQLYYVGMNRVRIDKVPSTADTLQTMNTYIPAGFKHIAKAYGRVWGAIQATLLYSDPYRYDLFRPEGSIIFDKHIKMVAPMNSGGQTAGLFVGFDDRTIFLHGANPAEMSERNVGPGVVDGTLAYCNNVPELGNGVPIWLSPRGIIAGRSDGNLVNMTSKKVKFEPSKFGASLARRHNGEFQFLNSMKRKYPGADGAAFGDSATAEVIRNGKVLS